MTAWTCQRSGECCTQPSEVTMTHAERSEIERVAPLPTSLSFVPHEDSRFTRLKAGPCPLYDAAAKTCTVYDVRPYSCRRFACGREDIATEPFVDATVPARFYTDRAFRRQLVVIQRHAQRWARSHGWSEN